MADSGLLLLLVLPAALCDSSALRHGSPGECGGAHMVPGYNLGGEGFDIVTAERKGAYVIDTETWDLGNGSCRLYRNSYMGREPQKAPAAVVDWRELPRCALSVSSTAYDLAEALVNGSTSSVANNWKLGLDLPVDPSASVGLALGGSHSRAAKFATEKSKRDRYNFYKHSVHCSYYLYRMASAPPLSKEFSSTVNSLPPYSSRSVAQYRRLLDTYGTHYITQVHLGGEIGAITAVRTCQASVSGLTESEVSDCLSVEASANVANKGGVRAMVEHCRSKSKKLGHNFSFSGSFNERLTETVGGVFSRGDVLFGETDPNVYNDWMNSLKQSPDVVRYNLKPLHAILPDGHQAKSGVKKEIESYIKRNAMFKKCSEKCKVGHRSIPRDPCVCVCNSDQSLRSNCCPTAPGRATLSVYGLYAQGLYGDWRSKTDGSVRVKYGEQERRTDIIGNNGNPRWRERFNFGSIAVNLKDRLKFKFYDDDTYWNSDLLGECSFELRRGKVSDSCMFDHGTFFFSYRLECAPSLGGERCQEYLPSQLASSIAASFYTRNGVLGTHARGRA